MTLPQQQLTFVPVQLCLQPALPCPLNDLQGLVQQGQGLLLISTALDVRCSNRIASCAHAMPLWDAEPLER
jgi:hypothetical protein